jgi:putative SOS response-associated peptidase YedK
MPVILPREKERVWLAPERGIQPLQAILNPYPAEQMQMYEISSRVNRTTEDVPELIKPLH